MLHDGLPLIVPESLSLLRAAVRSGPHAIEGHVLSRLIRAAMAAGPDGDDYVIELTHLLIRGELDLKDMNGAIEEKGLPLVFRDCTFDGPISLANARLVRLELTDCALRSIEAEELRCDGSILLDNVGPVTSGPEPANLRINLRSSQIGGSVVGRNLRVGSAEGKPVSAADGITLYPLDLTYCRIGGTVDFMPSLTCLGGASISYAAISGNIWIDGKNITADVANGRAIDIRFSKIGGRVFIAPHPRRESAQDIRGSIVLTGSEVSQDIVISKAIIRSRNKSAISMNSITCAATVDLRSVSATCVVNESQRDAVHVLDLGSASLTQVVLIGCQTKIEVVRETEGFLPNTNHDSIYAEKCIVSRSIHLRNCLFAGRLNVSWSTIGQEVRLADSSVRGLTAHHIQIGLDLNSSNCRYLERVDLSNANIKGDLKFEDCFVGASIAPAFDIRKAVIAGAISVLCSAGTLRNILEEKTLERQTFAKSIFSSDKSTAKLVNNALIFSDETLSHARDRYIASFHADSVDEISLPLGSFIFGALSAAGCRASRLEISNLQISSDSSMPAIDLSTAAISGPAQFHRCYVHGGQAKTSFNLDRFKCEVLELAYVGASGTISMNAGHFQNVVISNVRIDAPGQSIDLSYATIQKDLGLYRARLVGGLNCRMSSITGELRINASLIGRCSHASVEADRVTAGSIILTRSFFFAGFSGSFAKVHENFCISSSTFGPGLYGETRPPVTCLDLTRISVGKNLELGLITEAHGPPRFLGSVLLTSAVVGEMMVWAGCSFPKSAWSEAVLEKSNSAFVVPINCAILDGIKISDRLTFVAADEPHHVSLSDATLGTFLYVGGFDAAPSRVASLVKWPALALQGMFRARLPEPLSRWADRFSLDLRGFSFSGLSTVHEGVIVDVSQLDADHFIAIMRRHRPGAVTTAVRNGISHPYLTMAEIYRRIGRRGDVCATLIAERRARRKELPSRVARMLFSLRDLLFGYGYSWQRSFATLLFFLAVTTSTVHWLMSERAIVASQTTLQAFSTTARNGFGGNRDAQASVLPSTVRLCRGWEDSAIFTLDTVLSVIPAKWNPGLFGILEDCVWRPEIISQKVDRLLGMSIDPSATLTDSLIRVGRLLVSLIGLGLGAMVYFAVKRRATG